MTSTRTACILGTLCLEGHCTPGDGMCLEGKQVPERTAHLQRDSMSDKGQHVSIRTGVAWRDRMSLEGHMDFGESMCQKESTQQQKGQQVPVAQHVLGVQQPLDMQCHATIPGGPAAIRKISAQAYGGQEFTARINKRRGDDVHWHCLCHSKLTPLQLQDTRTWPRALTHPCTLLGPSFRSGVAAR